MRVFLKSIAAALAGGLTLAASIGAASAAVVGAFDGMQSNTQFVSALNDQGHTLDTLTYGAPLTAAYLSGVDVFVTGLVPENATAGELAALTDWVSAGGMLVITGEHSAFKDRYNTWLGEYGITLDGVAWNYNTPVVFATDPSDPYLANGVSGGAFPLNNRGWYSVVPAGANILATGTDGTAFALQLDLGAGVVIAVADTYFLQNGVVGSPPNAGVQFLLNSIEIAVAGGSNEEIPDGELPIETPLPGGLLLMASALGMAGAGRLRRKAATA